jgi:hypothetical protein
MSQRQLRNSLIKNDLVEAAGVEPAQDIENTQVVDSNHGQKRQKRPERQIDCTNVVQKYVPRPPSHTLGRTKYPPWDGSASSPFLVLSAWLTERPVQEVYTDKWWQPSFTEEDCWRRCHRCVVRFEVTYKWDENGHS